MDKTHKFVSTSIMFGDADYYQNGCDVMSNADYKEWLKAVYRVLPREFDVEGGGYCHIDDTDDLNITTVDLTEAEAEVFTEAIYGSYQLFNAFFSPWDYDEVFDDEDIDDEDEREDLDAA